MTSDRPYRASIGIDLALAEIRGGAGTQWDPEVVQVFVQMIEDEASADDEALSRTLSLVS
jgi:HD-GYP domain-containing protein (c-di-GMP phosphodiesterase class II)